MWTFSASRLLQQAGRPHEDSPSPVAIGGIGGSGTRILARLLQIAGYYIGDDINDALDNQWFTLLFKRRSSLQQEDSEFFKVADLFFSRMIGCTDFPEEERNYLLQLARQGESGHSAEWLQERVASFLGTPSSRRPGQPWGWKEPNTHIVIERLLDAVPDLRYIHLLRNPFRMAASTNQNQLVNWGAVFLDRDIAVGPRDALAYWCAAHRRLITAFRQWPGRTIFVHFEALRDQPETQFDRVVGFLGASATEQRRADFCDFIRPPLPKASPDQWTEFDPADLAYVTALGYDSPSG